MLTRIDDGHVWSDGELQRLSVLIEHERVSALILPLAAPQTQADRVIDASGLWILPGGIDMHVHVSDGAETFGAGSRCAAAGGITTVLDMAPFHGCVTVEQFWAKVAQAETECIVDFGLVAGIVVSLDDLSALRELAQVGVAYFKVFMPATPPVTARELWAAVQTAAHTGLRLGLHAEETGCLHRDVDWSDPLGFARSRPAVAESAATAQVLEMARAAGAPIHICHVSAARTADLISAAKAQGVDVTAEVPPHFLLLDESEFARQGPRVKTTPPLRTPADTQALWQALEDGTLDTLACDHFVGQPADAPASSSGAGAVPDVIQEAAPYDPSLMRDAPAGIGGLELSLPLVFSAGVREGRLSLGRFVEVTAERPAAIAGLVARKGRLGVGADADLIFIDPDAEWTVCSQGDFSRAAITPFAAWRLLGRVKRTMVRGRTVWDGEQITAESGWGQHAASRRLMDD
jgi:dihydroorotase-like cyclic amidohydrolase